MHSIPAILRPDCQAHAVPLRAAQLAWVVLVAGAIAGAVMGSFGGIGSARWPQILVSAVKVPLLLLLSFGLTLPSFFILNTLLGLRQDLRLALAAVVTAQSGLVITLVSLSPFVALWYVSCGDYPWAILFNGATCAVATLSGQVLLRRHYRQLINRNSRHRVILYAWTLSYAFVAIQMAWVLRPFVGNPSEPTTFFRHSAWGNAYVILGELVWNSVRR